MAKLLIEEESGRHTALRGMIIIRALWWETSSESTNPSFSVSVSI